MPLKQTVVLPGLPLCSLCAQRPLPRSGITALCPWVSRAGRMAGSQSPRRETVCLVNYTPRSWTQALVEMTVREDGGDTTLEERAYL